MLTLKDCTELAGLTEREVEVIARHEHVPDIVALEKAVAFLEQEWGPPALRQMVLDELLHCLACGDRKKVNEAQEVLEEMFRAHPGGRDRRQTSRGLHAPR